MEVGAGRLSSEAVGEIEELDGVLVIKRIRVLYRLRAPEAERAVVDRVLEAHPRACPVYRSLHPQIDIRVRLELEDE